MKYLKQFLIILTISFSGEILHQLLPLPVPASIYGILLLFALLKTGILPLASVRETARFLVEIMPVMFIPAAVGIMDSWGIIAPSWLEYLIMTAVSTVIVMAVSGLVTQAVLQTHLGESSQASLRETSQTHLGESLQASLGETSQTHLREHSQDSLGETPQTHLRESSQAHSQKTSRVCSQESPPAPLQTSMPQPKTEVGALPGEVNAHLGAPAPKKEEQSHE